MVCLRCFMVAVAELGSRNLMFCIPGKAPDWVLLWHWLLEENKERRMCLTVRVSE